ncbi:holo-ACP synthase [Natronobiforma cellulositropha]|uniref:holo-ACP synthase n=1 Tax=Natronobiforma cellulositropha TaxID=1679076 RepID=UPI0021D5F0CB|nr:4'-phosphopantetheinyl transferase superfamily protein [Natronobiforma cellulositropha]
MPESTSESRPESHGGVAATDHAVADVRVGVDVQSISRFAAMDDAVRRSLLERVFTDDERAYCDGTRHPNQHYAVRWAAKEAFVKTLDDASAVPFTGVSVRRTDERPSIELSDVSTAALERSLGTAPGAWTMDVSLSHDRDADTAFAQVVVLATGGRADD